jgi:protein-S-isoprenylcysteine O-methyltransferase Ste14
MSSSFTAKLSQHRVPTSDLFLSFAILQATTLSGLSYLSPNSNPVDPKTRDTASLLSKPSFVLAWFTLTTAIGLYHALLILFPPASQIISCPSPEGLNPNLFSWNAQTVICILVIFICAPLRLLSFRHLGSNFTYRITPPSKLVTTGVYRYVQHPSYTAIIGIVTANTLLLYRPDGVASCWLGMLGLEDYVWILIQLAGVVGTGILVGRISDEEEMLRKTFGKEWEVWHGKTKRFIPWVF